MKQKSNRILFLFIVMMFFSAILATVAFSAPIVPGTVKNVGSIGGTNGDIATGLSIYKNGNFVVSGFCNEGSFGNGDFTNIISKGADDSFISVFDYDKTTDTYAPGYMYNFGGENDDYLYSVVANSETGGFMAVGYSYAASFGNGDWTGATAKGFTDGISVISNGDFGSGLTGTNYGVSGFYSYLYDIASGNGNFAAVGSSATNPVIILLSNTGASLGTVPITGEGRFNGVTSTPENTYTAVGYASIFDSGTWAGFPGKGGTDAIVVRFALNGNILWKYNFGGESADYFNGVAAASDGGVVAVGYSYSFGTGDLTGVQGNGRSDAIIVKFDTNGNIAWKYNFGGAGDDCFHGVAATQDGGFVAVGYSTSNSFETGDWAGVATKGYDDAAIVKYDADGHIVWKYNFGGESGDIFNSVDVKSNGDIIAVGYAYDESFGTDDLENLTEKGSRDIVYAVFSDIEVCNIKFLKYANNKDVIYEEQDIISGNKATQPAVIPTRLGFTFAGWYTDEECRIPFNFNTPVTAGGYLYPKWRAVGSDVTINYFDGVEDHVITAPYGSRVTVTAADVPDFVFAYWMDQFESTRSYDATYSFIVMGDTELQAMYDERAPQKVPIVSIDHNNILTSEPDANNRINISFFGDIVVPDGFTVIERGIIGSYFVDDFSSPYYRHEGNFNLNTSNISKAMIPGVSTKVQGTFLRVATGYDFCARTYLVYNDGTEDQIIYSRVSYYDGTLIP